MDESWYIGVQPEALFGQFSFLLNHARNLGHDLITTKNFRENWRAVIRDSKLSFKGADEDKCRRSFATYLYNKEHEVADNALAKIMGNSPYVLNKHYKSVIQAGEGAKFFKIGIGGKKLTQKDLNLFSTRQFHQQIGEMIQEKIEESK